MAVENWWRVPDGSTTVSTLGPKIDGIRTRGRFYFQQFFSRDRFNIERDATE
jgi:hypothetical protein